MTNSFKKSISIIISFALLVSVFALSEISAFAKNNEYEYYSADNKTIMIAQYTGTKTKITIPDKIDNKKVTVISGLGSKVKEVTIGKNITHIEDFAFIDAKSLKKITVNKNNENYSSKDGILYNKKGTKLLVYPASKSGEKFISSKKVTSIGNNAFTNSKNLKSVDISLSKNVGAGVFYNSKALKSVKLPKSLKKLSSYNFVAYPYGFFGNCKALKTYSIPKNITTLGNMCFAGSGLTKITVPKTVTKIGKGLFYNCQKLETVNIKADITSFKDYAYAPGAYEEPYYGFFENCKALKNVTAPTVKTADERTYIGTSFEQKL